MPYVPNLKKILMKTVLINNRYDIVITTHASYANDTNIKRAILCTYILGLCNLLGLRTRRPLFTRASHTLYYTMTRIRELLHFHGLFKIYFIAEDFFFLQLLVFFLVMMQLLVLCKHLQCNFFIKFYDLVNYVLSILNCF